MVLVGLLAALVCLILGLVLASGPWLIGSLAASAVSAVVLWRQRERLGRRVSGPSGDAAASRPGRAVVTGTAFAGKTTAAGRAATAPATVPDVAVWVVDGRPDYHARSCEQLVDAEPESIPLAQALEDGFQECGSCDPMGTPPTAVWVIDGRPDYHRENCARLGRGASEQIPRSQALEDGFAACDQCRPDQPEADESAPDAAPGAVWVVDGRPRYHLQNCLIIKDQQAEPIALAQAIEDGFMPCSMCEPNVTRV